jgi:hypothetical protein
LGEYTGGKSTGLLFNALVEPVEFHDHHSSVLSRLYFLFWGCVKHKNVLKSNNATTVKMENTESYPQNTEANIITAEIQVKSMPSYKQSPHCNNT